MTQTDMVIADNINRVNYKLQGLLTMNKQQRHINKLVKLQMSKGVKYYRKYTSDGYIKAIEKFSKALELDPNNANAYKYRGDVNMIIEPDNAIKDFTKAIELKPNYINAYESRAILYEYSYDNKQQEAISDYTTILSYNKNYFASYCNRSQIYSKLKQYNLSISDYTKAIALRPMCYRLYILRGQDYCKIQQYDKAIEDFTVAITYGKWYEKADGYRFKAKAYSKLKDYNKSVELYTKAIETLPEKSYYDILIKCYKQRSEAYLLLGEKEKADIDLKLAKESEESMRKEEIISF